MLHENDANSDHERNEKSYVDQKQESQVPQTDKTAQQPMNVAGLISHESDENGDHQRNEKSIDDKKQESKVPQQTQNSTDLL